MTRPLVLTVGDPSGIGPELVLKSWLQRRSCALADFFVLADGELLKRRAEALGLTVPIILVENLDDMKVDARALTVVALHNRQIDCCGTAITENAAATIEAIERSVALVHQGIASGLVTCPIAKKPLYDAGFPFPGHTEFLGQLAQKFFGKICQPIMMLAGPELKTVPVTVHVSLAAAIKGLTSELIVDTVEIVANDLTQRFKIARPRMVVAGINPHAGEEGTMGKEDIAIIQPAVHRLQQKGFDVRGPLPADTLFHKAARQTYDVALCMYHDQALIPVKTIGFDNSVNVTLGLPFVRTSPDHGTAFDIAEQGIATPTSLIAAIQLAQKLVN